MGCIPSKKGPAPPASAEDSKKHSDDRTQAQSSSGADAKAAEKTQKDTMTMTPGTRPA